MPVAKRSPPSRSPSPTRRPPPPSPPPPPPTAPEPTANDNEANKENAAPKEEGELSPGPTNYTLDDFRYPSFEVLLHPIAPRTETVNLIFPRPGPFWQWEDAVQDLLDCIREQRELRPHAAPFGGSIYCEGLIRFFMEVPPAIPGSESCIMQFHHRGYTVFDTESTEATAAWMSTLQVNPSFEEEWADEILRFLLACAQLAVRNGWVMDYMESKKRGVLDLLVWKAGCVLVYVPF
ncbi:uncharacterized protein BO66DRAFT_455564 [Aspergillus aculeatinus CBS 121060]|uniref:Uncharacterized protein n=1 Tax=Aspergillus aculeatinus CBS 121060 TaxID=1448322 RepID=A0ACD1H4U3_9EURO|nr:hypothetical protein BO66DRAFT_455564 [Aspergillus aculeatinus CBS 121060]RAH68403.1 hypothetical protein BO66DRAFT_455564 [Aspergillus aculeatinus CBS 121060]